MKNIKSFIFAIFLFLAFTQNALAALASGTIFELESGATANFVNGAGFNPANANFISDFSATSATGASPVISSASTYNFVSGDAGSWVYIASGTNWTPEWCKIASVNTGASPATATLTAGIGTCITSITPAGTVTTNATAGIATVASPSSGTIGIDYSQQTTAPISGDTHATQTAASTTLTDTSVTFTPAMAGDLIHITACTGTGCLTGWYEIVQYTDANDIVLDRTATDGTHNITAATVYVGGSGNFGALEDKFQSILPASSIVWLKSGAYTLSASTSTANTNCTSTLPCWWVGYNSIRGDTPTGANRPSIAVGANNITNGQDQNFENLIVSGSPGASTLNVNAIINVKVSNLTATAGKAAFGGAISFNSEIFSINGPGLSNAVLPAVFGTYFHDSTICLNNSGTNAETVIGNIFEACTTTAVNVPASLSSVQNNTIYGNETTLGVGISIGTTVQNRILNNILYGLVTGVKGTAFEYTNIGYYNDYYKNTTDVTDFIKGQNSLALDPQFINETNLINTGTVTSATTTLTDTGASFGVTNNVDILHITAITGAGCLTGGYMITGHTSTTLTLNNSPGTACTAISYFIVHGHNLQIGTNLKGLGFPPFTAATGSQTTSYPDVGGVQRQEPAGGGTVGSATP